MNLLDKIVKEFFKEKIFNQIERFNNEMSYITTKGFLLRIVPYRDNDVILDILTSEYGLITCSARNIKIGRAHV